MKEPSIEAGAVVRATLPEIRTQQAALTMRLWYHLPETFDRDTLFASYDATGAGPTLVEALLDALSHDEPIGRAFARVRTLAQYHCEQCQALQRAFLAVVADLLGARATEMVLNAWRQLLATFFRQGCGH